MAVKKASETGIPNLRHSNFAIEYERCILATGLLFSFFIGFDFGCCSGPIDGCDSSPSDLGRCKSGAG